MEVVCALKKNTQLPNVVLHQVNYLSEQMLNIFLVIVSQTWVLCTSWKALQTSFNPRLLSDVLSYMLAGAGLVFHKASSRLVSAAEERRVSWMVTGYPLMYVYVCRLYFMLLRVEQCIENNLMLNFMYVGLTKVCTLC